MKPLALAALSLLLSSGAATASTAVPRVNAIADAVPVNTIDVACHAPRIRLADIDAVLGTQDAVHTAALRHRLAQAVSEACDQGVARIVVTQRGLSLDWAPAPAHGSAIAIALR
jgi:hypothetical protein